MNTVFDFAMVEKLRGDCDSEELTVASSDCGTLFGSLGRTQCPVVDREVAPTPMCGAGVVETGGAVTCVGAHVGTSTVFLKQCSIDGFSARRMITIAEHSFDKQLFARFLP